MARYHWVGTLHLGEDTAEQEFNTFWAKVLANPRIKSSSAQVEKAPTTGAIHIQFYVWLTKKATLTQTKREIDAPTAHLEGCIRPRASWDYCIKEDTRLPGGDWPKTKGEPPAEDATNRSEDERIYMLLCRFEKDRLKRGGWIDPWM